MQPYLITTDSTTDLPKDYYKKRSLPFISLRFTVEGHEYLDDADCPLSPREFYDKVRAGQMPSTAQVNASDFEAFAAPILEQGMDILHLAFSSGLSGTYHSCCMAAEELRERFPEREIIVIDTLAASLGEGLLVYHALQNQENGMGLHENSKWVEENKLHLCHWFTVDDLHHLHRGGRVSKTSAILGSLMGIKPVLHVDNDGHLILREKVRGRAASINRLLEKMKQTAIDPASQTVFISHGDCEADAKLLQEKIKKELGVRKFLLSTIGPVIGAHSGPGTLALFYLGTER